MVEGKTDEVYRRVRGLVESLLEEGRKALESKAEDLAPGGKGGAKVLSEEEARTWRGDDMDSHSAISREDGEALGLKMLEEDGEGRTGGSRPLTPSRVPIPDGLGYQDSEDEVEASLLGIEDHIPHAAPNIMVTPSPSP